MEDDRHRGLGPADRPWLNNEFFEMIIRKDYTAFKPTDLIIIYEYFCESASRPGEHYTSDLLRLNLRFKTKADEKATSKHYYTSYMVKCMHPEEVGVSKILKTLNVFEKEITMYTETLPAIAEVLTLAKGYSEQLMPRLFYHSSTPTEMMVIEDMSNAGYSMPNRAAGLNKQHAEMALTRLAQMHAASMVLNKKDPKFRAAFNKGGFLPSTPESFSTNYCNGIREATKVMRHHPKTEKFIRFYRNYVEHMTERVIGLSRRVPDDEDQFNVLNHGDFCVNNMLFKYTNSGMPIDIVFIDFQMCTFGNCGLDLNFFFFTSVQDVPRDNYRKQFLTRYLTNLTEVLESVKYNGFIPTFENLEEKLYETKDIAIITPCVALPLVKLGVHESKTITADKKFDITKCLSVDLYTNQYYFNSLQNALEHLRDIGYIKLD